MKQNREGRNLSGDFSDITQIVVCFNTVLMHVVLGSVALLSQHSSASLQVSPDDVLQEIINIYIDRYNLNAVLPKRGLDNNNIEPRKRQMVKYNSQRAFDSVMNDWMHPRPRFNDKQFERTFRIKKYMVDYILSNLARTDSFWTQTRDAVRCLSIHPIVKLLTALKCCALEYLSLLFRITSKWENPPPAVNCSVLSEKYLRSPTKSDARRIVKRHKTVHGIDGMMGSLDVTKIKWEKCPQAWKGQFVGKEGYATIGLEAVADYDLWIWHSAFGFPGALNNINIWDRSTFFNPCWMDRMRR
eukprot:CCRYP_020672-RA/>CCRYP_020672-RA protein AED:0.50 eAED:-0.30 QI:0/-1/0/1/-1/1/1/0/299